MYPDPSIVRVGEDYYMVNSSFYLFFREFRCPHSRDLVHWETIGYVAADPDWAREVSGAVRGRKRLLGAGYQLS